MLAPRHVAGAPGAVELATLFRHVRRSRRQDAQRCVGVDQAGDDGADGAGAADGEHRFSFLKGCLPRQLDGVFAAFSFFRVGFPPGRFERFHNGFDEGFNRESSRRWVVDNDRASHG